MRHLPFFTACCFSALLLTAVVIRADAPAPPAVEPEDEVGRLFQQLSDEDFKVREAARKGLIERGDAAVPEINKRIKDSTDPETRAAVEAILKAIEDGKVTGPSLITLNMTNASPREVFDAVAKQSRANFRILPQNRWDQIDSQRLTLNVTRQPFWAVMKDLLAQVEMRFVNQGPETGMVLMPGRAEMNGPSVISGPFMVIATGVNQSRSIRYGAPEKAEKSTTNVNLEVYVEPRLEVLSRDYNATIEEFVDDAGHDLASPTFARAPGGQSGQSIFSVSIQVGDVEGRTKRIGKLKGSVRAVLQTKSQTIEIPHILGAKGATQTKEGWTLTVTDVSGTPDGCSINVTITRNEADGPNVDALRPPAWTRVQSTANITVRDAMDRPLRKIGGSTNSSGKKFDGQFRFSRQGMGAVGEPAKLVWTFPTGGEEVIIPFEFKDLPLP